MELTENQKERIRNINGIQIGAGLLGNIGGLIYAKKTGGGFWRSVGYFFLGGLIVGVPTALILTPFKNRILKEGDEKKSTSSKSTKNETPNEPVKMGLQEFNDLLVEANSAEKRIGQPNQLSRIISFDPAVKKKYIDNFRKSVTNEEWKALKNFYANYEKSLADTFQKIGDEQKKLVQIGTAKIFGLYKV